MSHQHVPNSGFRQSNKSHSSGKHDSKGSLKKKQKGKVSGDARVGVKSASKVMSKKDKKAMQQQMSKNKKLAVLDRKRFGTIEGAPKTVAIIELGEVPKIKKLHNLLLAHFGKNVEDLDDVPGPTTVGLNAKQRMTLLRVPRDVISVLDISKAADILLLVVPAEEGMDELGDKFVSLIKAQGLPNVFGIIEGLDEIPEKKRHDLKKEHQKILFQHFPEEPRVLPLDNATDAAQVIRFIEGCTVRSVHWREKRPYLLVDHIDSDDKTKEVGTVRVSGYLRGGNMTANQLVHLPGLGDFQLKQIDMLSDPNPVTRLRVQGDANEVADKVLVSDLPNEQQELLISENVPDLLLNEQTWPTPEELETAPKKKKVPKGTSAYQASWIVDEDEEGEGEGEGEEDEDGDDTMLDADGDEEGEGKEKKANGERVGEGENESESESDEELVGDDDTHSGTTATEISRSDRAAAAESDLTFPDEVECPIDTPARIRFQKYRGLKSFRTTPWDPKENLPLDYGRIFQFGNFNRSMNNAMDTADHPIPAGNYITLHIANVPLTYLHSFSLSPTKPLVVGGLFKHENKMSVLQFNILKHPSYEPAIQSKDDLIFHVGIRRYTIQPIFSTLNPGCAKQKFERFLQPNRPSCASIYGPVTFPPNPLIVFTPDGELAATGTLHAVDPDRIVVKKIILTGTPAKCHKKGAVIRDMFYFPEDALWFKPVELWTKGGKVGHIKESVGTHGLIKCTFDTPVNQNDTVCLSLYKRVFPKWPKTSPSSQYTSPPSSTSDSTTEKMDQ